MFGYAFAVPIWVHGMDAPHGVILNTDVGKIVADALGGLDGVLDLYIDLDTTDLEWSTDYINSTHPADPMATVNGYIFPFNTDYMMNGDVRVRLPGITVYAPMTNKLYLSNEAIEMVKSLPPGESTPTVADIEEVASTPGEEATMEAEVEMEEPADVDDSDEDGDEMSDFTTVGRNNPEEEDTEAVDITDDEEGLASLGSLPPEESDDELDDEDVTNTRRGFFFESDSGFP